MAHSDNNRIVKNTLVLYFRMLFLTAINLLTVRVIFNALGGVDYGVYSVIGSAVLALTFLTGTLTSATQRYFSYQVSQNNHADYSRLFSLIMICFMALSVFVVIIGIPLGPLIVNHFLSIPADRLVAADWVYYSTLGCFITSLLSVPYTSSMIAHEKMGGFAYISIADGVFKLIVAYLVYYSGFDRLIYYSILTFVESLIVLILYALFCHQKFEGVKLVWYWEKKLFHELLGYTGWNLFGSVSGMLATAGQNIVLNLFFGPLINAAKGIADRISHVIQSFSTNFYLAVAPQIIKSYATGERDRMNTLVLSSSKFSFFLLAILSYPLILCMPDLLNIWLRPENVSKDMVIFSQLILIYCLVQCLEQPITQMIRATGKIKMYQIRVGIFTLLYLPVAILFLWGGAPAWSTMIVLIADTAFVQIIRLIVAKKQLDFSTAIYIKRVIVPIIYVSGVLLIVGLVFQFFWEVNSLVATIIKATVALCSVIVTVGLIGLSPSERQTVLNKLKDKIMQRA